MDEETFLGVKIFKRKDKEHIMSNISDFKKL